MIINEPSTALALFGSNGDHGLIMHLKLTLKETVDAEILNRAAQRAIERYPYLAIELRMNPEAQRLEAVPNARPIVVMSGCAELALHSKECNYHMLYICYHENVIRLNVNHGFVDGTSFLRFVRTLLYLYLVEKGEHTLDKEGVWLPGDVIDEEEFQDPLLELIQNDGVEAKGGAFHEEMYLLNRENDRKVYYEVTFSAPEMVAKAKNASASPATMVPAYMCKAIYDVLPKEGVSMIGGEIAINLRSALNRSKAHHNISTAAYLIYPEEQREWSVDQIAHYSKKTVEDYIASPRLLQEAKANAIINQQLLNMKPKKAFRMASGIYFHTMNMNTFSSSYVGHLDWGGLEDYIESAFWVIDVMGSGLFLELNATKEKFFLSVLQPFEDDRYAKRFAELLEQDGIPCTVSEAKPISLPLLDLKRLLKV